MLDTNVTTERAVLVDHLDRPFSIEPEKVAAPVNTVHPLNDPDEWAFAPAMSPPVSQEKQVQMQKWIDSIMGVTRNNESIYKLVWNGDRDYWLEYYIEWDGFGQPKGEAKKRPRCRYKTIRDVVGNPIRDVFPPRWLLLTRLEPEQYADSWETESYLTDTVLVGHSQMPDGSFKPEYRQVSKLVRPVTPPPVFWMHYSTIAEHGNNCCVEAEREKRLCYGNYADPYSMRDILGGQAQADREAKMTPFAQVDGAAINEINEENAGYLAEISKLQSEQEIFIENPMALIGIHAGEAANVNHKKGRQIVREHFERRLEGLSNKL